MSKICVVGLGYIGLPTAALLASHGNDVFGVDINPNVVSCINKGEIHIVESGLQELVFSAVNDKKLKAGTSPISADVFIIAVPTPFMTDGEHTNEPDLRHVMDAVKQIAPYLKQGDLLLLESTSPVGTTEQVADLLTALRKDLVIPTRGAQNSSISIAYCPERVLPGQIIYELSENDRVIGGITPACSEHAQTFYQSFVSGQCFITTARTAEMVKLTENASRDTQIAFANEVSMICDEHEISTWDVIALANKHPRVNILEPGPGVGGHCIAVDPWFIVSSSPRSSKLIKTARQVNDYKPTWVVKKITDAIELNVNQADCRQKVVLYGLAFKPNIDDLRESPALLIAQNLKAISTIDIYAVEPNIQELKDDIIELITLEEASHIEGVHVLLVSHIEFQNHTPNPTNVIIDTKGLWTS